MGAPVSVLPAGVQAAGILATSKVTANTRVLAAAGPVGVLTDVMQFPGPPVVGNWIVGAMRVSVSGIPAVSATTTGASFSAIGVSTGPMVVALGDPRVQVL
jgi:hypothetical protein